MQTKPILQIKDQVIVQDLGAGPGPATQAYREKINLAK